MKQLEISVDLSNGNHILATSPDAGTLVPEELVKYLWELITNNEWKDYPVQTVTLRPEILNGRSVQDIYHSSICDNKKEKHRVFGIEPVDCKLLIRKSKGNYWMRLCENL